jgi:hypothetical protein
LYIDCFHLTEPVQAKTFPRRDLNPGLAGESRIS